MVKTIGGAHVHVVSLLDSPEVNPRVYQPGPQAGRDLAKARLVVMNGLGFDGWMDKLLQGAPEADRRVIKASEAAGSMALPDKNWHLFYSPRIMLATAIQVAGALSRMDPQNGVDYRAGLMRFRQQLQPVDALVKKMGSRYPGLIVTAAVPVYAYMFNLLGWRVLYHDLQFANMNNSEPSAQQVGAYIRDLQRHKVHLLLYNLQVQNRLTRSLIDAARQAGVPTVGVSAVPLHGENYAQWQIAQLHAIEKTLEQHS